MSGAILSILGGWWARLWSGHSPGVGVVVHESPRNFVGRPEPKLPASPMVAAEAEEQSFRETVKLEGASAVSPKREPPADVRERTLEALSELRQIPALQSLVTGFLQAMSHPDVTISEVVRAIENDAALCVRVLRMANSVAISPMERIEDLSAAVQMLGVVRVRRVAQAVFTLRDAREMTPGLDWRHLWVHAFATASIAEELERRLCPRDDSAVHLAALLHDVGKIVLSTIAPEEYREILVASWQGEGHLEELERGRLGVDHREAGVVFARYNQLPAAVIGAIADHASPESATQHRVDVALVSLANFLSKAHGLGFSGARLTEADGEFEDLPAWRVLAEEIGRPPDMEMLHEALAEFVAALRAELRSLREAA